jgi:hypothetical protein
VRGSSVLGTSRPSACDAEKRPASGWVELGLKVSPEPTSARRCGSPSPLFQRIRRCRKHLSPSSRRSSRFQANCLPPQRPVSQRRLPFHQELSNNQPIMVAEGRVPADEPASYALEEFGNGFLTISGLASMSDVTRHRKELRVTDANVPNASLVHLWCTIGARSCRTWTDAR